MFSKFHTLFDALTRTEQRVFQSAVFVFTFSLIIGGVSSFYRGTTLAPVAGGSYTEGIVGQPIAINPIISSGGDADKDLMEIVFRDVISLAQTYKASADYKTWTVSLKEDLRWSDGEKITSDDIVFTLEAIQNPEARSPLFAAWQGVEAERTGEREVQFVLKTPYAFFLENLKGFKVVPEHIFAAIPAENLRLSDYNFEPVGNGPYAFTGYEKRKDGFITAHRFTANPYYEANAPLIPELIFRYFPDYESALTAFNRREIDGLGGLAVDDLAKLKISHQIQELTLPRYYALFFNPNTAPALKATEVREALTLVTDKEKLLRDVLLGRGLIMNGPLHPDIAGFDQTALGDREFSPEKARTLLENKGWKTDEFGVRSKKMGKDTVTLSFELIVPQIDFLVKAAQVVAADWKTIGAELTPIVLAPNEITNSVIKSRDYQILLFGNILKNSPDVFSFWHSSERFRPGLNLSFYESKTADTLLESIRTDTSEDKRTADLKKLQAIIAADRPVIFLFSPNYLYASPRALGGFSKTFIAKPSDRLSGIGSWYLKTTRVLK